MKFRACLSLEILLQRELTQSEISPIRILLGDLFFFWGGGGEGSDEVRLGMQIRVFPKTVSCFLWRWRWLGMGGGERSIFKGVWPDANQPP